MLIRSFYIEWEQFEYKKCCFSYVNWPIMVGKQILYVRSLFTIVVSKSDSQFSPEKISPRHISTDIFLLEIIIQEHISPGILSSTDIYLQVILRFLPVLFYPAHFSLGRNLTSDKVLQIQYSPRLQFSRQKINQWQSSTYTIFS